MSTAFARFVQRQWWRPAPGLFSRLLAPLALLTGAIAARRRAAAERRPAAPLPVPVIVVGNVIVGGAGKTPTVIALIALLRTWGFTPGIVSRGHGRRDGAALLLDDASAPAASAAAFGDEPLLMHRRTGAPVVVARQRREAALRLLAAHPRTDVLVADDGLQHHALARDVEVIVFDGRGVGNGQTLPAGPLREPLDALWPQACTAPSWAAGTGPARGDPSTASSAQAARHDPSPASVPASDSPLNGRHTWPGAAVSHRGPARFVLVNGRWPEPPARALPAPAAACWNAERALGGAVELSAWARGEAASVATLAALRGRRILAAAGIGDPERFFSMLEACGLTLARLPLDDHARFDPLPWAPATSEVIVTEKDAVKLAAHSPHATRVWVVTLDFRLPSGLAEALHAALDEAVRARRRPA